MALLLALSPCRGVDIGATRYFAVAVSGESNLINKISWDV